MGDRAQRAIRWFVTLLVLAAVWSPVIRNVDGLPLSTYPMYAHTRSDVVPIVVASGIDQDGLRDQLGPRVIAATRDPLIAQSYLNDSVREGRAPELCREIAGRSDDATLTIEISTETHDIVDRAQGNESLLERTVHATCSAQS